MSDQQVITGVSIIIGGLSQLQTGIPVYHWQSVVNLAWFSAVTHLITLTVLRDEVRSNKTIRIFRLVGMTILMLMLVCVMGPIGYMVTLHAPPPNFPAWCLYQPNLRWTFLSEHSDEDTITVSEKDYNALYVALVLSILIYCFSTRVLLLFYQRIGIFSFVRRMSRGRAWKSIESMTLKLKDKRDCTPFVGTIKSVGYKLVCSIYLLTVSGNDVFCSRAWEVRYFPLRYGLC